MESSFTIDIKQNNCIYKILRCVNSCETLEQLENCLKWAEMVIKQRKYNHWKVVYEFSMLKMKELNCETKKQ